MLHKEMIRMMTHELDTGLTHVNHLRVLLKMNMYSGKRYLREQQNFTFNSSHTSIYSKVPLHTALNWQ